MEKIEYIKIGKIVNTHALKGSVKANLYTSNVSDLAKYKIVFLSKYDLEKENNIDFEKYEIEEVVKSKNQAIVKFKGVEKIEDAEFIKNYNIHITREQMEEFNKLEEDEYYIKDLIGLDVLDEEGNKIGILKEVLELKQDIFIVKRENKKDILIPTNKEYIKKVSIKENKIIVNLGNLDEI